MKLLVVVISLLQLLQCGQREQKKKKFPFESKKEYKEVMIQSHQAFLEEEKERIDNYVDSLGKEFKKTGTGLRYHIYKKGNGLKMKSGDVAVVKYKMSLLNGELLYAKDSNEVKEFTVDFDNVESGLHEGIKYMHVGDKALLIMPAHLAYGITGDQNSIPSQSTLIFDLDLLAKK